MSLRLEMLQVARLAPKMLEDSTELVSRFYRSQQNPDGAFKDRSGRSDLYYTVFGLEGLLALQSDFDRAKIHSYLERFDSGEGLDFIHLCCLARCWAALNERPFAPERLLARVESFRTPDGGYNVLPGSRFGTAYACFLGLAAYQDLGAQVPSPLSLVQSLKFLETRDGAWANERGLKVGSTNPTAAMVNLLHNLHLPVNQSAAEWLRAREHSEGGFTASPSTRMPDLLSTATTLHALAALESPLGPLKERCLDFLDTLWTNEGGFYGHWGDNLIDGEYTYYGLLALGHLSL
jgi:prenyltransferase beta subunit